LNYFDQRLFPLDSQIKDVIKSAFVEAARVFGGLPKDLSGNVYREFRVNMRRDPDLQLAAEADPNVIDLTMNEGMENKLVFGYQTWKIGLIHEMLHFWNAETFRYRSGREQWFNEGITEYYAFRIAIKLGLIGRDDIPARLGLPVGYYLNDSGIGSLSMSEAGEGERKGRHYFLVYCGGLVAGMTLDYDIRSHSRNTRSLDDLMKAMYRTFNRTDRTYTNADVLAELNRLTGKDYTEFFNRYITGKEVIPVGQYFSLTDLYFINNPRRFDATSQRAKILQDMFHF
jgi:predicted metalloprotease with PDZ domain